MRASVLIVFTLLVACVFATDKVAQEAQIRAFLADHKDNTEDFIKDYLKIMSELVTGKVQGAQLIHENYSSIEELTK
jgi:hypothetical protein